MKQFRLTVLAVITALLMFGCGSGSSGSSTLQPSKDVTVIDGYVKDGNVTDSGGQQATADADVTGLYHFAVMPAYPICFTVGKGYIADTNMTMDINMSAAAGSVISPVTTLAEENATIIANLAAVMHYTDPTQLFSDYIENNDTNLSKLSQLCYAMLKDTNATQPFLTSITTDFNATVDANVSALITHTLRRDVHRVGSRIFLIKLRDYNGTLANMETNLSDYKADMNYSYPVADKTALQSLVNAYTADETNATLAKRVIYADTSAVTDMSSLFSNNTTFNLQIGGWDTSKVTSMSAMFNSANAFNRPVGDWDTSNVTDMSAMFAFAYAFNRPIQGWNTSKVTNMHAMLYQATAFKQPVDDWDTSNVTDMSAVFAFATAFNQPISDWNTSKVTSMQAMFFQATAFNQPIGGWNTSNVVNMSAMFNNAPAFNRSISNWDTSKVTSMQAMFYHAAAFDQNISGWDVSNVTDYTVFDTGCPIQSTTKIPQAWWGISGL
jgi:surface protein